MAKKIRFNLQIDGTAVRDLEGLRSHFNIHDLLDYHRNDLLRKWLEVRGFATEAAAVAALQPNDDIALAKALVKALDFQMDQPTLDKELHTLAFEQKRQRQLEELKELEFQERSVVDRYHQGYTELLRQMDEEFFNDLAFLKTAVAQIFDTYLGLFKLDYRQFFERFKVDAPLAIFTVLMHKGTRAIFMDDADIKDELAELCTDSDILGQVDDHLIRSTRVTDDTWDDLEGPEKEYMVLSMEGDSFVRSYRERGSHFKADDVNGMYPILKGIEYKSSSEDDEIVYMEV